MTRLVSTKTFVATAIALGAVVAGSAAHARTDVTLVVDLNTPHRYVQPSQVYVQPAQVYVRPAPAFVPPQAVDIADDGDRYDRHGRYERVYGSERFYGNERFERRGPFGDSDGDGIPNRFDPDSRFYNARAAYRNAQWGDFDHDGVVNQFDRAPRNPRRY